MTIVGAEARALRKGRRRPATPEHPEDLLPSRGTHPLDSAIRALHRELTSFLRRKGAPQPEELAQEVWLCVARAQPDGLEMDQVRAYAYTVTRRLLMDEYGHLVESPPDGVSTDGTPSKRAQAAETASAVEQALSNVSPDIAEVFRLHHTTGLAFSEIAQHAPTCLRTHSDRKVISLEAMLDRESLVESAGGLPVPNVGGGVATSTEDLGIDRPLKKDPMAMLTAVGGDNKEDRRSSHLSNASSEPPWSSTSVASSEDTSSVQSLSDAGTPTELAQGRLVPDVGDGLTRRTRYFGYDRSPKQEAMAMRTAVGGDTKEVRRPKYMSYASTESSSEDTPSVQTLSRLKDLNGILQFDAPGVPMNGPSESEPQKKNASASGTGAGAQSESGGTPVVSAKGHLAPDLGSSLTRRTRYFGYDRSPK